MYSLLWDQLTGREHLLFYGRLKNLHGKELQAAVDESLKGVNLLAGKVCGWNRKACSGSTGMIITSWSFHAICFFPPFRWVTSALASTAAV